MCKWIVRIVGVLYLVALALLLIGTYGLFGQEQDPLAGVFLIPLGLPWNLWLEGMPDAFLPWLAALSPALNIGIFKLLCSYFHRGRADQERSTKEKE